MPFKQVHRNLLYLCRLDFKRQLIGRKKEEDYLDIPLLSLYIHLRVILHGSVSGTLGLHPDAEVGWLVSWCCVPSQPQTITSGLKTNFSLSPSYFIEQIIKHFT